MLTPPSWSEALFNINTTCTATCNHNDSGRTVSGNRAVHCDRFFFYLDEARTGGAGGPEVQGAAASFSNSGQDKYTSVLLPGLHTHTHINNTYVTHKKGNPVFTAKSYLNYRPSVEDPLALRLVGWLRSGGPFPNSVLLITKV